MVEAGAEGEGGEDSEVAATSGVEEEDSGVDSGADSGGGFFNEKWQVQGKIQ